eukprot:TRINITY_DN2882_c0_g1_i2.p1 TRINITY_DN2882_c0_g1~~TRINITY_DN2882_c0_g1_i2.p1  ORF type:complete len:584 (+),score=84.60 TRINITY_DN2882_c0_g1_i2:860-2611(+)
MALLKQYKMLLATSNGCLEKLAQLLHHSDSKIQVYALTIISTIITSEKVKYIVMDSEILPSLGSLVKVAPTQLKKSAELILKNLENSSSDHEPVESPTSKYTEVEQVTNILQETDLTGNLNWNDIRLIKNVGEGAYGEVWKASCNENIVACKIFKTEITVKEFKKIYKELEIMTKLKHPNITMLMGACITNRNRLMIITEFASRGDLRSVLPSTNDISLRLRMAHDIVKGLSWMADQHIIHRDLKLANLLVDHNFNIKIADFGLSVLNTGEEFNYFGGNVKYSPPEILRARYTKSINVYPYTEKTDVYGFGLIFWELLTKETVYVRPKQYEGKRGLAVYVLEGNRPMLKPYWHPNVRTLLQNCWSTEQEARPTFREILDEWRSIELDVLCPDPIGQTICDNLWREKRTETVEISMVLNHFSAQALCNNITSKNKKLVENMFNLLVTPDDDQVKFSTFCNVVSWFGPLNKESECDLFFSKIKEIFKHKSFHQIISQEKAENILIRKSNSSNKAHYLSRLSRNFSGEIVISNITQDGEIIHFSVINMRDTFLLQETGEEFTSFKKLVKELRSEADLGTAITPSDS